MSKTILIVDDEQAIIELIQFNLQKEGYQCSIAMDGQTAWDKLEKQKPDLVILDWMIPKIDGLELCKKIKADPKLTQIPVIMVSAKGDEFDKVLALEIGADDYISKPFSPRELAARVKAMLRRIQPCSSTSAMSHASEILHFNALKIDTSRYEAMLYDQPLDLTKTEFELLLTLAKQPNRVFKREQLLNQVWGYDFYGETRVVDVHIRRLRSKIEAITNQEWVKTVRGVGYKFVTL